MKAIPITQRCKSPMKLSDKTLAALDQGNEKYEDSSASQIGGAITEAGKQISKKAEEE
jgi:hypothetical protein